MAGVSKQQKNSVLARALRQVQITRHDRPLRLQNRNVEGEISACLVGKRVAGPHYCRFLGARSGIVRPVLPRRARDWAATLGRVNE